MWTLAGGEESKLQIYAIYTLNKYIYVHKHIHMYVSHISKTQANPLLYVIIEA